jgi:hypothetical protein
MMSPKQKANVVVEVYDWDDCTLVVGIRVNDILCSCFHPGKSWSNPPRADDFLNADQYIQRCADQLRMDVIHALWDAGFEWDAKHGGTPKYEVAKEHKPRPTNDELKFARKLGELCGKQYSTVLSAEGRAKAKSRWKEMTSLFLQGDTGTCRTP